MINQNKSCKRQLWYYISNALQICSFYKCRLLVSLVGKVPVYRAGGSGSIPGRTNTQGIKIIEKVTAFANISIWLLDFYVLLNKDIN